MAVRVSFSCLVHRYRAELPHQRVGRVAQTPGTCPEVSGSPELDALTGATLSSHGGPSSVRTTTTTTHTEEERKQHHPQGDHCCCRKRSPIPLPLGVVVRRCLSLSRWSGGEEGRGGGREGEREKREEWSTTALKDQLFSTGPSRLDALFRLLSSSLLPFFSTGLGCQMRLFVHFQMPSNIPDFFFDFL